MVLDANKNNSFGFLAPDITGKEQRKYAKFPYPTAAKIDGTVIKHTGNPAHIEITPASGTPAYTVTQDAGVVAGAVLTVKNLHATNACTVGGASVAANKTSVLMLTAAGYVLLAAQ